MSGELAAVALDPFCEQVGVCLRLNTSKTALPLPVGKWSTG